MHPRRPKQRDELDLEELATGDDEPIRQVHNHLPRLADAGLVGTWSARS